MSRVDKYLQNLLLARLIVLPGLFEVAKKNNKFVILSLYHNYQSITLKKSGALHFDGFHPCIYYFLWQILKHLFISMYFFLTVLILESNILLLFLCHAIYCERTN